MCITFVFSRNNFHSKFLPLFIFSFVSIFLSDVKFLRLQVQLYRRHSSCHLLFLHVFLNYCRFVIPRLTKNFWAFKGDHEVVFFSFFNYRREVMEG